MKLVMDIILVLTVFTIIFGQQIEINKETVISRDHEKRLYIENEFRKHEISEIIKDNNKLGSDMRTLLKESTDNQYQISVIAESLRGK